MKVIEIIIEYKILFLLIICLRRGDMSKKWFFSTFFITLIFLAVITFFAINSFSRPVNNTKIISSSKSTSTGGTGYFLREYNGKIGIFSAGSDSPQQVLDVTIDSLPDEDQQMLVVGIYAPNKEELLKRIEDYS
jgi:hypothetical protein